MVGRRSEASHQAVLSATVAVLEEQGYAALSVEAVARRAGVGKQTIYRWWGGSKARLVLDAFLGVGEQRVHVVDTGSVREDLLAVLGPVMELQGDGRSGTALANRTLMAQAQLDEDFAVHYRALHEQWNAPLLEAVRRGVGRGELRGDTSPELVIDLLLGAAWYRLLLLHRPLTAEAVEQMIDTVLQGCVPSATKQHADPAG